jgi:hypothetical protein
MIIKGVAKLKNQTSEYGAGTSELYFNYFLGLFSDRISAHLKLA